MKCLTPIWIKETSDTYGTEVPCGRCYNCVQTKRSSWTLRILMELRVAESANFVTLTYSPETVPVIRQYSKQLVQTLVKEDLQKFIKRLRKRITEDYNGNERWCKKSEKTQKWSPKIRYFGCGEYGSNTNRPHYHIILFNIPLDYIKYDPINRKYYSKVIEDIWKKGSVDIGKVERGSAHYMTKYHMFPLDERWIESDKRQKPFALMSRKPGIGLNFIDDKITDYYVDSKNPYYTFKDGTRVPYGRYYKQKINERIENENQIRELQYKSKQYAIEETERKRSAFETEEDFLSAQRDELRAINKKSKRQMLKGGKL